MIKEITEKECNNLYNEINTWKKACELACKECNKLSRYDEIIDELNFSPYTSEYFYQQAKKDGE